MTEREIERALRTGGASCRFAKMLVRDLKGLSLGIGPAAAAIDDARGIEGHLRTAGASRKSAKRLASEMKGLAITVTPQLTTERERQ